MRTYRVRLAIAVAASLIPGVALAQHDAHQAGTPQAGADLTQCLRVQPAIDKIITAATGRAEAARLSNSPAELRAAVESLEAALRDIRAQSAPCSTAAASTDPHAGHAMPPAQPTTSAPATQPTAGAADSHAGHTTSGGGTTTKPAPAAKKPDAEKTADPHAGHSAAQSDDKALDPVNGLVVDPAKAPKTTYQGRTYYFSSEQSRKEFLANPAKFAKKPKG